MFSTGEPQLSKKGSKEDLAVLFKLPCGKAKLNGSGPKENERAILKSRFLLVDIANIREKKLLSAPIATSRELALTVTVLAIDEKVFSFNFCKHL